MTRLFYICQEIRVKLSFPAVAAPEPRGASPSDGAAYANDNFPWRDKRQLNDVRGLAV